MKRSSGTSGTFDTCITLYSEDEEGDEIETEVDVEISYNITPFVRGVHTLSNGDPGYPDEGGEIEIIMVKDSTGKELDLTERQIKEVEARILEDAKDKAEAAREAQAEWKAECRRRRDERNEDYWG